jgi:steroid delta-isomerase-like uncharacterized protein
MSLEDNKQLVRRLCDVFNTGNLNVIDEVATEDFVLHHATDRDIPSREMYKQTFGLTRNAFPDMRLVIDDIFAEGDKVACRWTVSGTHQGEYQGIPPTNNKVVVSGNNIFRIANGKVAEIWSRSNTLGMMQQLGVIPPMGPPKK